MTRQQTALAPKRRGAEKTGLLCASAPPRETFPPGGPENFPASAEKKP